MSWVCYPNLTITVLLIQVTVAGYEFLMQNCMVAVRPPKLDHDLILHL